MVHQMKTQGKTLIAGAVASLILAGVVIGKPRVIDREDESKQYPDLQETEKGIEKNIVDTFKEFNNFGYLVAYLKEDRNLEFNAQRDPYDFRFRLENVNYTPRNTYIRYVKSSPEFVMVGFGVPSDVQALINEKVEEAKAAQVNAVMPDLNGIEGMELTQFDFIKEDTKKEAREVVGSVRKSMSLYYEQVNQQADTEQQLKLKMAIMLVVDDHLRDGVKDKELIIDPSPLDDNMDDIIIVHRYNKKVPSVTILGTVDNTPSFPTRNKFKQKFYKKLSNQFYRMYQLVDNYAVKDDNEYNEDLTEELIEQMRY